MRRYFPRRAGFTLAAFDGLDLGCPRRIVTSPEHVIHSRLAPCQRFDGHTEPSPVARPWNTTKRAQVHDDLRRGPRKRRTGASNREHVHGHRTRRPKSRTPSFRKRGDRRILVGGLESGRCEPNRSLMCFGSSWRIPHSGHDVRRRDVGLFTLVARSITRRDIRQHITVSRNRCLRCAAMSRRIAILVMEDIVNAGFVTLFNAA
jgi:hypothetical protein